MKPIIPYIIAFLLLASNIRQCSENRALQNETEHNITALNDTIKHWKTANGELAASKSLLVGDIDLLRKTNDSLYNKIKDMGVKNPQQVVYVSNDIVHETRDTVWQVASSNYIYKNFDFSDKWRELSGSVSVQDTAMRMSVDKDIVHLDFAIAVKDGRAYVSTSNPYVQFNDIQGIVLPTAKQKHWHLGPAAGIGIGTNGKIEPYIGVSLSYSLISF